MQSQVSTPLLLPSADSQQCLPPCNIDAIPIINKQYSSCILLSVKSEKLNELHVVTRSLIGSEHISRGVNLRNLRCFALTLHNKYIILNLVPLACTLERVRKAFGRRKATDAELAAEKSANELIQREYKKLGTMTYVLKLSLGLTCSYIFHN